MQKTKIEYLDYTWNPIAIRCTSVSDGCKNCWHLRMAKRFSGMDIFNSDVKNAYSGMKPVIRREELEAPLRKKKPVRIGVQFMGDMFHNEVYNDQIAAIFGVMQACTQHTFFVLTKRPGRMCDWLTWSECESKKCEMYTEVFLRSKAQEFGVDFKDDSDRYVYGSHDNIWLGVSVEDQKTADNRISEILNIGSYNLWVSCEPLLGCIDFSKIGLRRTDNGIGMQSWEKYDALNGSRFYQTWGGPWIWNGLRSTRLSFVVAGSETGPGARPCDLDWLRSIRDQCNDANVPFFLKQINAKKERMLDGRLHEEMP